MNITFEERQLMSLYNTGTRTGLIAALEEMRGYLAADETELRELTYSSMRRWQTARRSRSREATRSGRHF